MKVTKFMSWLKPCLVLSIICGFALTATAENYFPAKVGNTWVLLSADGVEQRTYTFEDPGTVDNEELILLNVARETLGTDGAVFDKSWVSVAEDGEIILHQVAFDRGAYGIAEATFDPPVTNFPAALPLGHTWEIVTETVLQLVGAATTTSTLEVVAIEDVETPIGVFKDCVKIETHRAAVTAIATIREAEILWLAPDVGPVKFQDSQEIVFELESYNLVEPTAPEDIPAVEETTDEVTEETTQETTEEVTEVEAPAEPTVEEPNADGGMDIVPNYYPTEIGNTWVSQSTDGTEQRTYTLEGPTNINGEELITLKISTETLGTNEVDIDNYFVSVRDGGLILHQSVTDEGAFGIAEATFDPPVTFFPALLPVGHTWEIVTETELEIAGPVTSTSTIEVVASEDVETPAGTFKDCVKLEIRGKSVSALVVIRTTSYQWLAPDVGPVKYQNDQGIVYELQSYNLVEAPTTEETPPTPVVEVPVATKTYAFDLTLEPGLNMISMPLMPAEPYTAKSLAAMLDATLVIRLDVDTQRFIAYTAVDEGTGFSIDGGKGYIVNTPTGGMATFTGTAWDNQPEPADDAPAAPTLHADKNTWAFVVTSDIRDMETDIGYILVAENLRTGIIATENITSDVKRSSAVWADLNRKSVVEAGDKLEIALYDERGNIVSGPFQRTVSTEDIRNAFLSLQLTVGDVRPKDTVLAQNFPNPFNPETWIPYQLSKSAEVSIHIHNVAGHLIRTLDLGLKPTGAYMTPSTAAYWDGKNSVGERVSSGIYFYTLQTADFAATRRMVILK